MAQKTKQQLKDTLVNGHLVTGGDFTDLVDSLKGVQSPVSSPVASGNATAFIDSISQDAEGVVTATKKTVDFNGYQTVAGMSGYQTVAGMSGYQDLDLQQVGEVTAVAGGSQSINHNMKHYPTVRLIDEAGVEVVPSDYRVKHTDNMTLTIELGGSLTGRYRYILD